MALRFSFLQGFNSSIDQILRLQQQTFQTQEQISTGRRIVTPADDPVASARVIQVQQELSQVGQYITNADAVENRLSLAENQIQQVTNLLARIKELTIQAGGLNTQADRQSIAAELDTRLDELFDLANTRDINGEYIFAGFKGGTQPFIQNADGSFSYQGDDGQRFVQIATTTSVPISDSGFDIFVDIPNSFNTFNAFENAANTSTATITNSALTDQANYDAVYPEDYVVVFSNATDYDVFTRSDLLDNGVFDGPPVFSGTGFTSGDTIDGNAPPQNLGWEIAITGTPAAGDAFEIRSTDTQGLLDTVYNLAQGLENLTDAEEAELDVLFATTLDNINAAEANMSQIKAQIGARQNTLDSVRDLLKGVELVNQEVLSELRDLDYAEALSRLTLETFTLEASQQSFARISNLSLFNFLR